MLYEVITINILHHNHVKVILAGVNGDVLNTLKKSKLLNIIGVDNICNSFESAVIKAKNELIKH